MIDASGIGVYLKNVLSRLISISGWNFIVLGNQAILSKFDWLKSERIAIVSVSAQIYSLREQFELARSISTEASLFWAPHYNAPLFCHVPLVVTIHDVAHLALPDIFRSFPQKAYAKTMLTAVRWRAEHIMFDSDFTKNEFEKLVGVPAGKQSVVHLGLDDSWRDIALRETQKEKFIIYVGNMKPHKNVGALVKAFDSIRDRIPHNLLIVGKREGFLVGDHTLREVFDRNDARIVFTGPVSDEELHLQVARAELLVLPSLYEGFGLPPLEAMACGCPVAVSNRASLPEICADAAIYFDPTDVGQIAAAIISSLTDQDLAQHLKKRGLERSATFNWDSVARNVHRIMSDHIM
ncbi:MAG TPA: glycosyltransferase family 1 protein [Rhizomicrobium sp.]